ncbi:MAG: hypothetical protein H6736_03545 [Alphaproteobacteria bacterium]|nr:hypothetical protein [Alphaproteobacteria bacterium]MCB9690868.1 hypothetical protein [Alphaproteobacteria bacterium]
MLFVTAALATPIAVKVAGIEIQGEMKPAVAFETYREAVAADPTAHGPGFGKPVKGDVVGYGLSGVLPGTGTLSWVLLNGKEGPVVGLDADGNGKIAKDERHALTGDGQVRQSDPWTVGDQSFEILLLDSDGANVVIADTTVHTGNVQLGDREVRVEWSVRGGRFGETEYAVDLDGDGKILRQGLAPEVLRLPTWKQVAVDGRLYEVSSAKDALTFEDAGPAEGPGYTTVVPGEPLPELLFRDRLASRGGFVVFTSAACGACADVDRMLATLDVDAVDVFHGSAEEARTWRSKHGLEPAEPVCGEEADALWRELRIISTPVTVEVGADGVVKGVYHGSKAMEEVVARYSASE